MAVNFVLAAVLKKLEGTPLGAAFKCRSVELATLKRPDDLIDYREALASHLRVLEHVDVDSLPLSDAGYLAPPEARALAAILPATTD